MKKKLLSILLSLALVITMMPAQTLVVSAATKTKATVSTQAGLKKALKNKKLKTLTIKTGKTRKFSVKKGTYKRVHMIIDASKSTVKNNSYFKKITIRKNKSLVMNAAKGNIVVSKGGKAKEVRLTKDNSSINFKVAGELKKIRVEKKSEINIKGSTMRPIVVTAGEKSDDTIIRTSVKVNATIESNAQIHLSNGSEGSSIAVTNKDARVTVVNNTDSAYTVTDADGKTVEIKKEETVEIGGNTPVPTPPAPTVYTVTFDLNGIEGTAPVAQTITSGGKITKPTVGLPSLENHTLQWFTKAETTKLSDKWDFDTDTVTENTTLYAQWTRTLESILDTNTEIPHADGITPPDNAWVNKSNTNCKAFVGVINSKQVFVLKDPDQSKKYYTYMDEALIKVNDDYELEDDGYMAACHMVNNKFVSFEYEDTYLDYMFLNGIYTAPTFKAVYNTSGDANTLTFYYDSKDYSEEGITVYDNLPTAARRNTDWGYNNKRTQVKNVVIDSSVAKYHGLTSTAYMLYYMTKAEDINGAEYLDVSNVTNMSYMFNFYGNESQTLNTVPNVSEWDTTKVTNMEYLFNRYGYMSTALVKVPDVSEWDTTKVTNMDYLFSSYGYKSTVLDKVPDVSEWNTINVTSMEYLFDSYAYSSLGLDKVPDVSEWDTTEGLTGILGMFRYYGHSSTKLNAVPDISNWNISAVTHLQDLFKEYGYSSTELSVVPDVSRWDTSAVTNMQSVFDKYGYSSTKLNFTLDLSSWNVGKVTNYSYMFREAAKKVNTWSVTIPAKTGNQANDATHWYVGDGTKLNKCIELESGRGFTLATTLWTGEESLYSWEPKEFLSGGSELKDANAAVGDILKFYVQPSENSSPWYLQILSSEWTHYIDLCSIGAVVTEGNYTEYDLAANNGTISVGITQDMLNLSNSRNGKFFLSGDNITCTKITLVK